MKSPERITISRLSDLALSSFGKLSMSRGLFSLGPEDEGEEAANSSFSFDANVAPMSVSAMDFAEMAKQKSAFDVGSSPSKQSGAAKRGKNRAPPKGVAVVEDLSDALARTTLN